MSLFAKLSISHKLIAITLFTSTAVILLMAVVITINEVFRQKDSIYQKRAEQLTTLAEIISSRSTAAILFNDQSTAQENLAALRSLRSEVNSVSAVIYDQSEEPFVEFQTSSAEHAERLQALHLGCTQQQQQDLFLVICKEVALDGDYLGEVRIVFDMSNDLKSLNESLFFYLGFLLVLILISFVLALLLSAGLQRIISRPILALRTAMEQVSKNKDYTTRVPQGNSDELGALVDGFNNMLAQIQSRDAELARYSSHLEKEIEERTTELAEANRKRLLWLENLAYFLRHELKNSTVGIRSSLDLIARRAPDANIHTYLERAHSSVEYMVTLLESVGSASTLEASFTKDKFTSLDIGALISQHLDNYRSVYPDVPFIDNSQSDIYISGNDIRLIQLLDKLVANAVDYRMPKTPITVKVKRTNNTAVLSVTNKGQTLPKQTNSIFDLFVSMRNTEHKSSENLGLGLYIVKLIAEAHDGTVHAENLSDASGVVFSVEFPLTFDINSSSHSKK